MTAWNYKRYGSAEDPIHKSHLNDLTGDYGCPKQFRYKMDERASGKREHDDEARSVSGKAAAGTAAHETIARALGNPEARARILAGSSTFDTAGVQKVFQLELEREVGGREVNWYDDDPVTIAEDRSEMIAGLLKDLHRHVDAISMIEAGFIVKLGEYWLSGHIDLAYRPKSAPEHMAIADWKTGSQKPAPIELDHGWESGVYSAALHGGYFLRREQVSVEHTGGAWRASCRGRSFEHPSRYIAEREVLERALIDVARAVDAEARQPAELGLEMFCSFPVEIRHVHLQDYVPYKKAGSKDVKRPEDVRFYNLEGPGRVKYIAGQQRGPAWLPVRRTEHDIPRLEHRLRTIVGMVRMGRFIDQVGEKCNRCPFADDCLNTGYAPRGDEQQRLERSLRVLDQSELFDGLG